VSDFLAFISAIKNHWLTIVTISGALFAIQILITKITELPFINEDSKHGLIVFLRWLKLETYKRRYGIATNIFLLSVIYASFQAWDEEKAVNRKEEAILIANNVIGKAIDDGSKILAACPMHAGDDQRECIDKTQSWGDKIDFFIRDAFGTGEQAAFEDFTGYVTYERTPVRKTLEGSLKRLHELQARLNSIPIRKDFDVNKYR
jgi:hypothetical protein